MNPHKRRFAVRKAATLALSAALMSTSIGVPATAFAQPNGYQAAMDQLEALQLELEQSEAVLGKTTYDLSVTKANIADLQVRIAENNKKLGDAKNELAVVIAESYRQGGDMGLLDLVLSSSSFENLVSRLYYANRVAASKESAIKTVSNLQASLNSDLTMLQGQQQEQEALLADQVSQFAAMQEATNRQATYVSGLSQDIVAAMEKERIETTIASLETAREVLSVQTLDNLTATDGGAKVTTTPTPAAPNTPALPIAPTIEGTTPTATQTPLQLVAAPTEVTTEAAPVSVTQDVAPTTTPSYSSGAATSTSASSGASGALAAVEAALSQVGKSYGHENDGSEWDCNGLTNYAWQQAGVEIPYASGTYSYGQFQYMKESDNWVTSEDDLKAGDLVFFSQDGGNTTYHVGMYIGDGQIVHAVGYSEGVQVTDLDYVNGFVGGGTPE